MKKKPPYDRFGKWSFCEIMALCKGHGSKNPFESNEEGGRK